MTRFACSSTRRCFITPKRVIDSSASSSVSVRPSRANKRSSKLRRVGSASALNTRSSSMGSSASVTNRIIGDLLVTCQARPAPEQSLLELNNCEYLSLDFDRRHKAAVVVDPGHIRAWGRAVVIGSGELVPPRVERRRFFVLETAVGASVSCEAEQVTRVVVFVGFDLVD